MLATADTNYRLASITKTITAAAILQLVEAGKLNLDDPIQKYIPSFPEKPWPVTPRELLAHTGGIRTYKPGEMDNTRHFASLTDALSVFKNDPLEYQPGTAVTCIRRKDTRCWQSRVEGASGMNYFDYVRKHIFEPAGMETAQPESITAIIPHRTQGYIKGANGQLVNSGFADMSAKAVVCTTAGDRQSSRSRFFPENL